MESELSQRLIKLRRNHAAWLLLASRNGPLILGSLKSLIDSHPGGIEFEHAVEQLAELFSENANDSDFEVGDDITVTARRELRQWVKRGLIVEREGQLLATDALQKSFSFIESLEDQPMTSTASRLATVQRAIENLELQLSQSQSGREKSLTRKIASLEKELAAVRAGEFEVLSGPRAEEEIREVYQLAVSLRADFRRVEDSYREADRTLRQRIISERQHRGQVVDELLDSHESLVDTAEGQVFESFHQQLVQSAELEQMKLRLQAILENQNTSKALERKQRADLRSLVSRLVGESARVIQARARSEHDVKSFLKSGLADEQIRVGAILQDILHVAINVDWNSQAIRRSYTPLRPVGVTVSNLPVPERLLVKEVEQDDHQDLDFTVVEASPEEMGDEFWESYRALDRTQLFYLTIASLRKADAPLSIKSLAEVLPPTHDLETLAYWLAMARQAGIELSDKHETIDFTQEEGASTRFRVPKVEISYTQAEQLDPGDLE